MDDTGANTNAEGQEALQDLQVGYWSQRRDEYLDDLDRYDD